VRVCVENPDGTSHLIIQGIRRVELVRAVRYKPFRVYRIRPLEPVCADPATVDVLLAKVRDLVIKRIARSRYRKSRRLRRTGQRRRLRMQPGLTCLWALEGRSRLSFRRWMELDLEYIDHWSMTLDWKIILRTVPIVLLGRGAS